MNFMKIKLKKNNKPTRAGLYLAQRFGNVLIVVRVVAFTASGLVAFAPAAVLLRRVPRNWLWSDAIEFETD